MQPPKKEGSADPEMRFPVMEMEERQSTVRFEIKERDISVVPEAEKGTMYGFRWALMGALGPSNPLPCALPLKSLGANARRLKRGSPTVKP